MNSKTKNNGGLLSIFQHGLLGKGFIIQDDSSVTSVFFKSSSQISSAWN